jgi:hypothetical protein
MPPVCDLQRLRSPLFGGRAVTAAAIPGDDLDRRPRREPCRDRRRLPVRQKIDHPPPFRVADQRPVAMPFAPRPVVHADDLRRLLRRRRPPTNGAQKRILAHRQQQPPRHPLSGATAERPAEMPNQPVQPLRPPGEAPSNRRLHPFREDPTDAVPLRAHETPHLDTDHDVAPVRGQVGQLPSIPTANLSRHHTAARTDRAIPARAGEDPD